MAMPVPSSADEARDSLRLPLSLIEKVPAVKLVQEPEFHTGRPTPGVQIPRGPVQAATARSTA
jgi:hypothetical protein